MLRNANAFDAANRTLLTEVDVENPKGRLRPGAYVFVHFKLPESITSVTIPSNALAFPQGRPPGRHRPRRQSRTRTTSRWAATTANPLEIVSGLTGSDSVIVDPPDSLIRPRHARENRGSSTQEINP